MIKVGAVLSSHCDTSFHWKNVSSKAEPLRTHTTENFQLKVSFNCSEAKHTILSLSFFLSRSIYTHFCVSSIFIQSRETVRSYGIGFLGTRDEFGLQIVRFRVR